MSTIKVKALTNRNYSVNGIDVKQLEPGVELELPKHIAESLINQKAAQAVNSRGASKANAKSKRTAEKKESKSFGDDVFEGPK